MPIFDVSKNRRLQQKPDLADSWVSGLLMPNVIIIHADLDCFNADGKD